ncbi:Rho GTPase activation protein [Artomyces pyxidatus]|uniref:Rho GTPase activation protein n=1 Tax=Artomyces pyxidatus TaxID=48021 RepID=A0ACB8SL21_9AGAM|nr:Rho GTPase activation protein [Artomyces pyxidatus]
MVSRAPRALSLKQRLAALTQSPSAPASPTESSSPKSPGPKRRFNAPWVKRSFSQDAHGAEDKLQETISRMIYQAGVDYETRPMVVLNASAMPDAREVNYDVLLARILSYLDLYVESDYTVIFFAAGSKNTPGWNWVWKAYRSLSRKYRKNLKRMYIVHSNFFTKMLFSLAGAFISPKFFRKITYIDTLSELACHVPLTQIDVPPAVYQENLKHERRITMPIPTQSYIFGVHLEDLMGYDGEKGGIPRVVKDCIQYLRETGLTDEGLFRRSPNSALLKQVQDAYDRGNVVSLDNFNDPNLAAVLLKKYLRDLPEPIFTEALYPIIQRCPMPTEDPSDWSAVLYIREHLLPALPRCNYILISHVLHLMHEVSLRSATNRMDAHNLAIVLCPNLVSSASPARDIMMCAVPGGPALHPTLTPSNSTSTASQEGRTTLGILIKLCIQRYYEVFDEVEDRSEVLPSSRRFDEEAPSSGSSSPHAPSVSLAPPKRFSMLSKGSSNRDSRGFDDDESIDDAMLVMPLGPGAAPPSAWGTPGSTIGTGTFRPRHRTGLSGGGSQSQAARSMHTMGNGNGNGNPYGTVNKARSTISIDKGSGAGGTMRRGSISVGRGTRKASGAAVEAVGVTASGFFTPPSSAPPVPTLPVPDGASQDESGRC